MKPLTVIYWTRVLLGLVAALVSTFLGYVASEVSFSFLNGLSIALLIYIMTYYVYKLLFIAKVEKPSKVFSTGVGAYFLTWIVAWILFYTLLFTTTPPTV